MESNLNQNFIFQNHKIVSENVGGSTKIKFMFRNDHKWIENFELPMIFLENEERLFAAKIIETIDKKNRFKIIIQSENNPNYNIQTEIIANESLRPWFHVKTILTLIKDMEIIEKGPEVHLHLLPKVKLLNNSININQPTKHNPPTNEWLSNDLPAAYIWNSNSKLETYIFFNLTEMTWMIPNTIPRFSFYEIGLQLDGSFGLLQIIPLPEALKLSSGTKFVFDYYISQNYLEKKPSKWEAVEALISRCFHLLPEKVDFPLPNLSWHKFCNGCISDLMKKHYCWEDSHLPKYHAYVRDSSELKRRESFDQDFLIFETMTMLDLLPPWLIYLEILDDANLNQREHVKRACKSIKQFIDPVTNVLHNNIMLKDNNHVEIIKPDKFSIGDSWYFFEPIVRFGWFIRLYSLNYEVQEYLSCFKIMCDRAIEFVNRHNYEITAFYDPYTLSPLKECLENDEKRKIFLIEKRGEDDIAWKIIAKNYACLGIFIYLMIQGFYLFKTQEYLDQAKKSAKKFMNFSPNDLFWEPIEIAYGVAGFTELNMITGNYGYLKFANQLLLNELRMFYWYNDNTLNFGKRNILGLVQACVGIRYPAMKENVESVYPWLILLKSGNFSKVVLKFFNLIRINSFYYFSNVLESIGLSDLIYPPRRETECEYIPFEDLEMLETPAHFSKTQIPSPKGHRSGTLGREIYGAGEVIWLYLMFEALATTDNKDIMILNLDLFDFQSMKSMPLLSYHFVIYNPFSYNISFNVSFNLMRNKKCNLVIRSSKEEIISSSILTKAQIENGLEITLDSGKYCFLDLETLND